MNRFLFTIERTKRNLGGDSDALVCALRALSLSLSLSPLPGINTSVV